MNNQLLAEKIHMHRLITEVAPEGVLSYVADSYDFWGVVTKVVPSLKQTIMARNGKVVIRPDSGDPVKILTGYKVYDYSEPCAGELESAWNNDYEAVIDQYGDFREIELYVSGGENCVRVGEKLMECEVKGLVEFLWDTFGGTITDKGFKVMDEHIGCIYGDSITLFRQKDILQRLADKGFASSNVVLGIGSYTYQYVTRDTHGSAVKATSIVMEDEGRVAIAKDPKTGDGNKKSAKGLLKVIRGVDGTFALTDNVTEEQEQSKDNMLQTVWKDGNWVRKQTLEEIREVVRNN